MKKKPPAMPTATNTYTSPLQGTATDVAAGQRTAGTEDIGTARTALSQFLPGAEGSSAYRRNLYGGLAGTVARGNDNAMMHTRERAEAAGFAGQPIAAAAEDEMANAGAGRISQIPLQVDEAAIPIEMGATNAMAGLGGAELGDARSMFGQAAGMEDQRLDAFYKQQEAAKQRKAGIWGSLAKIGMRAAGAIPGVGPIIQSLSGG